MRASTLAMVRHAQDHGYAVPAFNIVDEVSLRAVIEAADAANSPVIIQASLKTARDLGVDLIGAMFDSAVRGRSVSAALHLDHCPDIAWIEKVIAAGWSSVLFDASDRAFDKAVAETAQVVQSAHAVGVEVESEIENIVGVEDGVGSDVLVHSYTPQQLVEAATSCGIDLLAPQLGTAHGRYAGRPTLLPERVREFRRLTDTPIVLHGGTGLTQAEFRLLIAAGVSKINISTDLKHTYMRAAYDFLKGASERDEWDPPSMFRSVSGVVRAMATSYFEIFGSAGQAVADA